MNSIVQNVGLNNIQGYGGTQRAGFIGVVVGFIICAIGCFPPYWKTGSISMEYYITVKMLDFRAGLWLFCVKAFGIAEECDSTIDIVNTLHELSSELHIKDTSKLWLGIIYVASGLCLFLSLVCGLAACCRICCCTGGKTICHGIMAFIAGGCGVLVVVGFALKADDIYGLPLLDLDYGWAFFLFMAGSAILVISSLMLCFSSPRENSYHLMATPMTTSTMPLVITQTSTSGQMPATAFPPVQAPAVNPALDPSSYGYDQTPSQLNQY